MTRGDEPGRERRLSPSRHALRRAEPAPLRFGTREFLLAVACLSAACVGLQAFVRAPLGTLTISLAGILAAAGALRGQVPRGIRQTITLPAVLLLLTWLLVLAALPQHR